MIRQMFFDAMPGFFYTQMLKFDIIETFQP
nr:MAG TPA: hypothetical protein [Bacteriophage sp.]